MNKVMSCVLLFAWNSITTHEKLLYRVFLIHCLAKCHSKALFPPRNPSIISLVVKETIHVTGLKVLGTSTMATHLLPAQVTHPFVDAPAFLILRHLSSEAIFHLIPNPHRRQMASYCLLVALLLICSAVSVHSQQKETIFELDEAVSW